jgi:hypothetical protein
VTRAPLARRLLGVALFGIAALALGHDDASGQAHHTFQAEGTGVAYPARANGTLTEVPALRAHRLGAATLEVDGVLDESVWGLAETAWGFQEADPNRFGEVEVPTTFKIVYDDDAIYFGVACWEDDVADIASYLSRRDEITASDFISIYIDPYHDLTTGYNFRITADGVIADHYIFDNGNRDPNWNAVWEVEVSRDARGWYAEVRVPFSAIRFKGGADMVWGLQVYRWLHGRGQDTGWVVWDRDASGFVNRWGKLEGLEGIGSPRKLEVLPYVVTRHHDPAIEGDADEWDHTQNFGVDLKYGPTPTLTLNATIQPDFGQVEADPAVLNLSPFEIFYEEKRPFFVEGARFFQHPHFNMFYSRRIGTGDLNSRIRGAAKLTGKVGGNTSVAALLAATDLTGQGQSHNPLKVGEEQAYYGLLRFGREFDQGAHNFNLMGTVVKRNQESFRDASRNLQRDAVTGGFDFELTFDDRMYTVEGSAVGTLVDPFADAFDEAAPDDTKYGTGGFLEVEKESGVWRWEVNGAWETDELDPNDMGFLVAPDEMRTFGEISYNYDADGRDGLFNNYRFRLDGHKSWLYADGQGEDLNTGIETWNYDRGHRQFSGYHFFTSGQLKSYHQAWFYYGRANEGTDRYVTRSFEGVRGPLMTRPSWNLIITGITTDWRKPFSVEPEFVIEWGDRIESQGGSVFVRWNQGEHFSHSMRLGYTHAVEAAQWIFNAENDGSQPGVTGIGGVDHVFGELDQEVWDLTLRSNVLFTPNQSLQLYLQPFLTRGNYSNPRWLARPDSYDLRPYATDASQADFNYGALNLNLVYRWEYRPGSTLYLVWTQNKEQYEERGMAADPGIWDNDLDTGFLLQPEPGNTFLAKLSYWFSL